MDLKYRGFIITDDNYGPYVWAVGLEKALDTDDENWIFFDTLSDAKAYVDIILLI